MYASRATNLLSNQPTLARSAGRSEWPFHRPRITIISIVDIHRTNAFLTGIPPNWKNVITYSWIPPILLKLAHPILNCCRISLVACRLEIAMDDIETILDASVTFSNASITLSSCILTHLTFLSLQGNLTG